MTSSENMNNLFPCLICSHQSAAMLMQVPLSKLVRDFERRFLKRLSKLRSKNELFTSNEVKYIFFFAIRTLILINNCFTQLEAATIDNIFTILSEILNNLLSFGEIIPVIDINIAGLLATTINELKWKINEKTGDNVSSQYIDLSSIPTLICTILGGYKSCEYSSEAHRCEALGRYDTAKYTDDFQSQRKWLSTLTRIKSGAEFSRQFNEGECPVCFDKTDNFAISACGHGVCFICLDYLEEFGVEYVI